MVNGIAILLLCGLGHIHASHLKEELHLVHHRLSRFKESLFQDINHEIIDTRASSTSDTQCLVDMKELFAGLKTGSYWALKSKLKSIS